MYDIGPAGETYMNNLFAKAAAWYTEYAFLRGLGGANFQPMGVLNATCTVLTPRNVTGHISDTDVANMAGSILPYCWVNSIWACSPTALKDLVKINGYIPNASGLTIEHGGCCGSLLSRPLFVTDKLPALGTKGDLIYFDPSLYVIGDRQQLLNDVSDQFLFSTFQTAFRIWVRCDGRPALDNTVTLADATTVASGFVALNT